MTSIIGAGVGSASAPKSNWLADTMTAIQNSANPAGILGALSNMGDGSLSSFIGQTTAAANNFATIAQSNLSSTSAFYAQLASQNQQQHQQDQLKKALDQLNQTQTMIQPKNTLDPLIFFPDGTTIDTSSNIMTKPDGTQYDVTTGAKYVDPASIIQMANGAYLNTSTNVLTLGDGTQIDTITGLNVSTTT
jgi:hypothetical protein